MNYDELLYTQDASEGIECNCYPHVHATLLVVAFVALIVEWIRNCRSRYRVNSLEVENATMKSIILTSLDKTFSRMVKNGYESDNEHED